MPKRFPEEVKLGAMELYLAGDKSAKQIADIVSKEHDVDATPSTI